MTLIPVYAFGVRGGEAGAGAVHNRTGCAHHLGPGRTSTESGRVASLLESRGRWNAATLNLPSRGPQVTGIVPGELVANQLCLRRSEPMYAEIPRCFEERVNVPLQRLEVRRLRCEPRGGYGRNRCPGEVPGHRSVVLSGSLQLQQPLAT